MAVSKIIAALERLQSVRDDYSHEQKREVEGLYRQVFHEVFTPTSCSNCYHDAVDKMWAYIRKHGDVMPEREFVLKHGAVINLGGFGSDKFYIRHTLTDALALEYLRKNPQRIGEFERYPQDWQARLTPPTTSAKKTKKTKKKK